ncbi:MAG: ABC transporter permease [Lentilitoribacter sp.]
MEILSRPRKGGGLILSSLLEPISLIIVLMVILTAIGQDAAFGGSIFTFLVTGFIPIFVAMRVALRVMGIDRGRHKRMRLPSAKFGDYVIAITALETLLYLSVAVSILIGCYLIGYEDIFPEHPLYILLSLVLLALLGMGVGVTNIVIIRILPIWQLLYPPGQRLLLFMSGLFYVVDYVHVSVRELVVFNPISHGIIMFRDGYYGNYPDVSLSVEYLFMFGFSALFLGSLLERFTRKFARDKASLDDFSTDAV